MIEDVQFTDERWLQFWQNYKGLDHQKQAVLKLAKRIRQADACLLSESADWVSDYKAPQQAAVIRNPLTV